MNNLSMISNPNEITKRDFDELDKIQEFDKFTNSEISKSILSLASLVKKGEESELSTDETDLIKSITSELNALKHYTINDFVGGHTIKSDIYVHPKQVSWEETLEKSENGESIIKGTFLNTSLNRELGRVGVTFEKGKPLPKKEKEEEFDKEMMKSVMDFIKKGSSKKEMFAEMTKDSESDKEKVKRCITKGFKETALEYLKKSEEEDFENEDSEEEVAEKSPKSLSS